MEYPESDAVLRDGNLSVTRADLTFSRHYCGYCRLPRLVAEPGHDGLLTYVPVHGGITYANKSPTGQMVYGFDCAHAGDETNLWWHDLQAVLDEARKMSTAIHIAALFEPFYLLPLDKKWAIRIPWWHGRTLRISYTLDRRWKARVIDAYHRACRKLLSTEFTYNLGSMIALLSGRL